MGELSPKTLILAFPVLKEKYIFSKGSLFLIYICGDKDMDW